MTVNKISRFIGALSPNSSTEIASKQTAAPQQAEASQQAVTLAPGLKSGGERAEKVARVAQEVKNGTYKVDSKKVAQAIYNELFS